jgi:hypothetical protein
MSIDYEGGSIHQLIMTEAACTLAQTGKLEEVANVIRYSTHNPLSRDVDRYDMSILI